MTPRPFLLLLPLLACVRTPPALPVVATNTSVETPPAVTPAAPTCVPMGLLPDAMLAEGHVVVLGEFHGIQQSQRAVEDVLCQALLLSREVVLALEIPEEETERLDAFLAGGGREELLTGDFWRRDYQDGRSSQAMFELIERVRAMQTAGRSVSVVLMDSVSPGADRDNFMAGRVMIAHKRSPQAVVVVLVGNIHARAKLSLPRSMAHRLKKAGVPLHTVRLEYGEGTAWACDIGGGETCGEHHLPSREKGPPRPFEAEEDPSASGFEGRLYLGPMEASPPAVRGAGPTSSPAPASPPRP